MAEEVKTAEGRDVKIGELLVAVGVVTNGDLQEAIQIAKRMALPIGRVIVMSGVITEANLAYALEAQSLVRDGLLDFETAVTGLKNAYDKAVTLQVALAELRWAPKKDVTSNKLGELLVDSNMVTQSQLDGALQASFDSGMPLGGTLVIQGVLSAQLLPMVLNAQEQIRDGKVTRAGAVENLKAALMFWAKADSSKTGETRDGFATLQGSGSAGSGAGALSQSSYMLGDAAPPARPQAQAQSKAPRLGPLPPVSAAAAPPSAVPGATMSLVDMMKITGYCTAEDIQAAVDRALSNPDIAAKLFMATGLLDKASFDNFLRCRALMQRGVLRPEQATYALSAIRMRGISLEAVLNEMGIRTD